MAAKKCYAVRKGRETGIFYDWDACKAVVEGYPGEEYKGFVRIGDAEAYLGSEGKTYGKDESSGAGGHFSGNRSAEADPGKKGSEHIQGADRGKAESGNAVGSGRRTRNGVVPDRTGGEDGLQDKAETEQINACPEECPPSGTLLAYVDGSYDHSLKKYAFGCVFILPDGRIKTRHGNGDDARSLQQRNVTGEMLGAMYAVRTAMVSGFSKIEIRYDYEGIEKWVTGAWRSRTELTQKYAHSMRRWGENITICFTKVAAHSNVYYNEMADRTAKAGLREGDGIPTVCRVEEL